MMAKQIVRSGVMFVVAILLVTVAQSQVRPDKGLLGAHETDETSADTSVYVGTRSVSDASLHITAGPRDGYSTGESAAPVSTERRLNSNTPALH